MSSLLFSSPNRLVENLNSHLSMMGFSFAVSFGSEIVLTRSTHQTRLINSTTTHHKNNTLAFNFSNHKDIHTPIFVSKQESIQFDERKSPNQVTLTHLLFSTSSQSFKNKYYYRLKKRSINVMNSLTDWEEELFISVPLEWTPPIRIMYKHNIWLKRQVNIGFFVWLNHDN